MAKETMRYENVPVVPQDFEGAVAAHREATNAINYWKEQQRLTWKSEEKQYAQRMIERWFVVKDKAQVVIQSYQLRLF